MTFLTFRSRAGYTTCKDEKSLWVLSYHLTIMVELVTSRDSLLR